MMQEIFKSYVTEGLSASSIQYGTNPERNNGEISVVGGQTAHTFFLKDGISYLVYLNARKGEAGFGANQTGDQESNRVGDYGDERVVAVSAIRVFGHVIFVLKEIVKRMKPMFFKIAPKDDKLYSLYRRAFSTPSVQQELEDVGYSFEGELNKTFYIKRQL